MTVLTMCFSSSVRRVVASVLEAEVFVGAALMVIEDERICADG